MNGAQTGILKSGVEADEMNIDAQLGLSFQQVIAQ